MKIYFKLLLLLLIVISCTEREVELEETVVKITPTFVTTLNPTDDLGTVSNNVIQGIASFENGWFVTQKSGNSILLINYLDQNGTSLFNKRLLLNSHGQDLSLKQISDNELHLYTSQGEFTTNRNTGVLRLNVQLPEKINDNRDWSQMNINFDTQYNLNYTNCTPTLSEDKQRFAIRSKKTILVHSVSNITNQNFNENNRFELNNSQLKDNEGFSMSFQGIAMKDNFIYCLTGNRKLTTNKKIYKYNQQGITITKLEFDKTDVMQEVAIKFEPEGLTILENELYFTIMTKSESLTGNIKYLYKIDLP